LSVRCVAVPVGSGSASLGLTGNLSEIRPNNIASLVAYLRRMAPQIDSGQRSGFDPRPNELVNEVLH